MLSCFKQKKVNLSKEEIIKHKKKHLNIEIINSNKNDSSNTIKSIVNNLPSSRSKKLDIKFDSHINGINSHNNKIEDKNLKLFDENPRFLLESINNYNRYTYNSLPFDGWIKPCYNKKCRLQTSRFVIINHYSKYYFCHECLKNLEFLDFFRNVNITQMETNWKPLFKYLKI